MGQTGLYLWIRWPVDSQSTTPGVSIAFEKTQPKRTTISLNSFIGQCGAAGKPTKKTGIPVLALACTSCMILLKSWPPLSGFCTNVIITALPRQVAGRGEQRTLQVKALPGTCGTDWVHTTRGAFTVFLCWVEKGCQWKWNRDMGWGQLSRSTWEVLPAPREP